MPDVGEADGYVMLDRAFAIEVGRDVTFNVGAGGEKSSKDEAETV